MTTPTSPIPVPNTSPHPLFSSPSTVPPLQHHLAINHSPYSIPQPQPAIHPAPKQKYCYPPSLSSRPPHASALLHNPIPLTNNRPYSTTHHHPATHFPPPISLVLLRPTAPLPTAPPLFYPPPTAITQPPLRPTAVQHRPSITHLLVVRSVHLLHPFSSYNTTVVTFLLLFPSVLHSPLITTSSHNSSPRTALLRPSPFNFQPPPSFKNHRSPAIHLLYLTPFTNVPHCHLLQFAPTLRQPLSIHLLQELQKNGLKRVKYR